MEIALERVTKVYDNGVKALSNLDFVIHSGELLAVVGPSGCGKTTTLRLIAGLEEPTEGTIRMGGRVVNSVPPRLRNVGMVFQRPALNPQQTVRGNLEFGMELRQPWFRRLFRFPHPDPNPSVVEVAQALGLDNELDRLPAELSGGQEQRVALGRALIRRPDVLLLDEPLGHLDSPLRVDLRRQLHLLHQRFPATMVYVTHDPQEALALGNRVAVLDRGTLQQVDTPERLLRRPVNRQVARLCQGRGPLNLLDGQLGGENLVFSLPGLDISVPESPAKSWMAFRGRPVTVGIRPEDIEISERNSRPGVLHMKVDLIELLDEGFMATCSGSGLLLSGMCHSRFVRGQDVMLTIAWQNTMLFDGLTGQTLAWSG
ncbi:MAG TPA: ABC transporter ATP-binding protein [Gemmataceae bacterium]|nr:ABC transporter ATP-binding protein [Gemmataceae bacterium]